MDSRRRTTIVAVAVAAFAAQVGAQPAKDACAPLIPTPLRAAIEEQLPGYRLPAESDNLPEDVQYNRDHGGSGCLGLAMGDYHGKKSKDYALLVSSRSADQTLLIIATQAAASWHIERLRDWGEGRSRLYVETIEKGSYRRTEALGPASEPGELDRYTSGYPGVLSGATESSGVAYFFTGHRWVHVWVAD
jgi:hypothetical protein